MTKAIFGTAAVCLTVCFACSKLNKQAGLKDDNIIEESIEALIEEHLDLDIDLTPGSAE